MDEIFKDTYGKERGRNYTMMHKALKRTGLLLLMAVFLLIGSACQGSSSVAPENEENTQDKTGGEEDENQTVDYAALADELKSLIKDDSMTELDSEMIEATYGFNPDILEGAKIYLSSGSTANEVAVFLCKGKDDIKTVTDILGERVKSREESYREYNAKEAEKLKGAVIGSKGNCVILVVVEDSDAAKEILNKY